MFSYDGEGCSIGATIQGWEDTSRIPDELSSKPCSRISSANNSLCRTSRSK